MDNSTDLNEQNNRNQIKTIPIKQIINNSPMPKKFVIPKKPLPKIPQENQITTNNDNNNNNNGVNGYQHNSAPLLPPKKKPIPTRIPKKLNKNSSTLRSIKSNGFSTSENTLIITNNETDNNRSRAISVIIKNKEPNNSKKGSFDHYSYNGGNLSISENNVTISSNSSEDFTMEEDLPFEDENEMLEKWKQNHERRTQIVNEIVETEKTYCENIIIMVEIYKASFTEKKIKTEAIFSNIEVIMKLSGTLLQKFALKLNGWNLNSTVGDIFCEMAPQFEPYITYIKNHEVAIKEFAQLEKKKEFINFLKKVEEDNKGIKSLPNLLIMPVQRLPRYELLLRSMLEKTHKRHPDYKLIEKGLFAVTSFTEKVDETIQKEENLQKSYVVQKKLGLDLMDRTYIMEGVLTKICRKTEKKRLFFLFSDLLLYSEADITSKLTQPRKHNLLNTVVVDIPDSEGKLNAFQIYSLQKSFIVFADTPAEKENWIKALNMYALKSPINGCAPVWIPDKEQMECMLCHIKFTLITRRHHCRKCGKLVCDSCSKHKMIIESISKSPVRACTECFKN